MIEKKVIKLTESKFAYKSGYYTTFKKLNTNKEFELKGIPSIELEDKIYIMKGKSKRR